MTIKDHLGNEYKSVREMCEQYGIKENTYYVRLNRGWTLEETLTGDKERKKPNRKEMVKDHLGNEFSSIKEMCEFHNADITTFMCRRKKGLPLEDCLRSMKVKDHLGNVYDTVKEMCEKYGVSTYKYYYGLKNGYSLERMLTAKRIRVAKKKEHTTK